MSMSTPTPHHLWRYSTLTKLLSENKIKNKIITIVVDEIGPKGQAQPTSPLAELSQQYDMCAWPSAYLDMESVSNADESGVNVHYPIHLSAAEELFVPGIEWEMAKRRRLRAVRIMHSQKLKECINSNILSKLAWPAVVGEIDLSSAIAKTLSVVEDRDSMEHVWDQVIERIVEQIFVSQFNEVGNSHKYRDQIKLNDMPQYSVPSTLVNIGSGVVIRAQGIKAITGRYGSDSYVIEIALLGVATDEVAGSIVIDCMRPFVALCEAVAAVTRQEIKYAKCIHDGILEGDVDGPEGEWDEEYTKSLHHAEHVTAMRWSGAILRKPRSAIGVDSLRMLTALKLLYTATRADDLAVAVALSVAAIEAVLVDKKDSISDQMARRIAVMYCTNRNERGKIIKCVKKMYGYRSDIVHGNSGKRVKNIKPDIAEAIIRIARSVVVTSMRWSDMYCRLNKELPINSRGADFHSVLTSDDENGQDHVSPQEEYKSTLVTDTISRVFV